MYTLLVTSRLLNMFTFRVRWPGARRARRGGFARQIFSSVLHVHVHVERSALWPSCAGKLLSTELGVAEREGRYGFRRARRGPSGHALFGRVNSAECPGAQPTPTHPLPSLLHTAIYHPLADYQEFRDRFPKRHLSLSLSILRPSHPSLNPLAAVRRAP